VIPGVEVNTDVGADEVHILGYCVDLAQEEFQEFLRTMRAGRVERAERMVEKLHALGVRVEWSRVRGIAAGAAVGRPHVARALVEAGRVGSVQEAFDRYLRRSGPAYVPRPHVLPEEAVEVILRAGGVPVLAHPGWQACGAILQRLPLLVEHGLCGIEVYYPDHTPEMVQTYVEAARCFGLIVTGGTDYHGGGIATRAVLGGVGVPPDVVPALRERWKVVQSRAGHLPRSSGGESPPSSKRH
jgi:predicted metal-dependent phosphoesterase TrpH